LGEGTPLLLWGNLNRTFSGFARRLSETFSDFGENISEIFSDFGGNITEIFINLVGYTSKFSPILGEYVSQTFQYLDNLFQLS
jgi:hypothetical protein